ncbi:hypothetical protein NDU88_002930 [Pleurodeles waltl]|uniref:Uncharacterized protein n=1 Tax=Pleurodeles waltl TaxID=8319 RepID=A0AAV7UAZ7_PLEWA|nr:hypothetical protein NDU88_002930 [Pleurodeles waltl]
MEPVPSTAYLRPDLAVDGPRDSSVRCTQLACNKLATRVGSELLYSPLMPLAGQKIILMTCEVAGVRLLAVMKAHTWEDLYVNSRFKEQDEAGPGGRLTLLEVFLYIRLRRSISALSPSFSGEPPYMQAFHNLLQSNAPRHLVSTLYRSVQRDQPGIEGAARTR